MTPVLIELDSIFNITFYNTNTCRGVYFGMHLVYKGEEAKKIGDGTNPISWSFIIQ